MAISKVIYISSDEATPEVWMDVTQKTVTPGTMLNGTTALKNDGTGITGNIASKSSTDLEVSGGTVTAPAGYYSSAASKSVSSMTLPTSAASSATSGYTSKATISRSASDQYINIPTGYNSSGAYYKVNAVANGSATTPSTSITANPSISVGSGGLITASVSASQSVTPTVSAGYVSSGTAGTVSVSGSNTSQLTTQAAQTIYPSTSDQTISSGKYLTGTQTIKGVLVSDTLTAANIASGVTVKIGDSADDDRIISVTGTHEGGGGSSVEEKDVNFIDYDGTILYSYTATEAQALTALPANPSHTGLTAQGWNWTLANIKNQLTNVGGKVWVGQMYVTSSGATEIDIVLDNANCLSPILFCTVNGSISVNWGDNTTPDTITGTSLTSPKYTSHTYATVGSYTLKITASSGSYAFYNDGTSYPSVFRAISGSSGNQRYDRVYSNAITDIRLGNSINFGSSTFVNCQCLKSITIPYNSSVTAVANYAFDHCYSIKNITIPKGITTVYGSAFFECYSLYALAFPDSITNIGNSSIASCYCLKNITIPSSVTSIGTNVFNACYSLTSIAVSNSTSAIGNSTFSSCYVLQNVIIPTSITSIGNNAFQYCQCLQSLTLPNNITTIGNSAFYACYNVKNTIIPNSVTSVGTAAFQACYALLGITLSNKIASIGADTFNSCYSLQSIIIPETVTSIGNSAFKNCYSLHEYHLLPTSPPTLGTTVFSGIQTGTIIYVPYSADHSVLEAYQTASNWSAYASYMQEEPQ